MSKPYYDIDEGSGGWLGRYATGATGATDVVLTPAVVNDIEASVDAFIEGRLGTRYSGTTPPIIKQIAGMLTAYNAVDRANQGLSIEEATVAHNLYSRANIMLDDIMNGRIQVYQSDGTVEEVTPREGVSTDMADDTNTLFDLSKRDYDWQDRETVYGE